MTHTREMSEHEGEFNPEKPATGTECRKCRAATVTYRTWESSCGGYEDYEFACQACGHTWWVDGIDS